MTMNTAQPEAPPLPTRPGAPSAFHVMAEPAGAICDPDRECRCHGSARPG